MLKSIETNRDLYAAALVVIIGTGAILEARSYTIGTLVEMGPGFFPLALGIVLVACGVLIGFARAATDAHDTDHAVPVEPEWRGWCCIIGGLVWFIVVGDKFGMFAGTFGCVFVAAMGDRTMRWRSAFMLALATSTFGVLLFSYGLRVQLPAFAWWRS